MARRRKGIANAPRYSEALDGKVPYLKEFLSNYAESTINTIRNKFHELREYAESHDISDITQLTYNHLRAFLIEHVDNRLNRYGKPIKIDAKERWRTVFRRYFEYVRKTRQKMGKHPFGNPVPDRDLYRFSRNEINLSQIREKKISLEGTDYYEQIVVKMLNYYYYNNFEMFLLTGFLAWSGPRISELLAVKTENIDLEYRFFLTKLKDTAAQSNNYGVYFFPAFFKPSLELYLKQKELLYPGETYLFPSPYFRGAHLARTTLQKRLNDTRLLLGINRRTNPHFLRKVLNTYRKRKGVEDDVRQLLLNHAVSSVEASHYNLDYDEFARVKELYDKSFPFPEFKPKKIIT